MKARSRRKPLVAGIHANRWRTEVLFAIAYTFSRVPILRALPSPTACQVPPAVRIARFPVPPGGPASPKSLAGGSINP